MKKKALSILILIIMAFACCAGCSVSSGSISDSGSASSLAEDVKTYAIITKGSGNTYNELVAEGFAAVIEEAGGNCLVYNPSETTAEAQIEILDNLISMGVDSITIAANDANALSDTLQRAKAAGITVTTVDSDANASDRTLFINQASTETIARTLVEAVHDITGGSGQWAILSATSQASNQNAWIKAMRSVLEEEKYQNLRLVSVVYGNDDEELSAQLTEQLLADYPSLKVICAPTSVGMVAAASVLATKENISTKVTGLGLPSAMASYVGSRDVCPYLFLWNPIELGQLAAYASIALVEGKISGTENEAFVAGDMGTFTVSANADGALQVILAPPIQFDSSNIDDWKDIF